MCSILFEVGWIFGKMCSLKMYDKKFQMLRLPWLLTIFTHGHSTMAVIIEWLW